MNTIKKKLNILLFIAIIVFNFSHAMKSDHLNQDRERTQEESLKQPLSLLDLCKIFYFKKHYNDLDSLKNTYAIFNTLLFSKLPTELKENLIEHFNKNYPSHYHLVTWQKFRTFNLLPPHTLIEDILISPNGLTACLKDKSYLWILNDQEFETNDNETAEENDVLFFTLSDNYLAYVNKNYPTVVVIHDLKRNLTNCTEYRSAISSLSFSSNNVLALSCIDGLFELLTLKESVEGKIIIDSHFNYQFPENIQNNTCSLDQQWLALSSQNRTQILRFDGNKNRWVHVQFCNHDNCLPLKIYFSSDNNFLAFEFHDEIDILQNENGEFPGLNIRTLDKRTHAIRSLIGFSKDNYLITHSHYARLNFWDSNNITLPRMYSVHLPSPPSSNGVEHVFTNPSCSQFYYFNGENQIYTPDLSLTFEQITLKRALEKYILENNLKKLCKLQKSKKLVAFDPINRPLMEKYIKDGIEQIKNVLVTDGLHKMWEYNQTNNIQGLRSLLDTIFPEKHKNLMQIIKVVRERILIVAYEYIIKKINKNKNRKLNIPLLVLFEKKDAIESFKIDRFRRVIQKTIKTVFNEKLNSTKKHNELTDFFDSISFTILDENDQRKITAKSQLINLRKKKNNFLAFLKLTSPSKDEQLLEETLTEISFPKQDKISSTKGLLDLLQQPESKNPFIITRDTIACAA